MELQIKILWDAEADVWVTTSDDVPGLAMESGSFDALVERLRHAVPELLALNGTPKAPLQMNLVSQRRERLAI